MELDVHTTEAGSFDMAERGMFFAFGVRDYVNDVYKDETTKKDMKGKTVKDMPEYVEWHAKVGEGDGDKAKMAHDVKMRKCTPEDWKKFYTPSKKDIKKFNKLKSRDVMWCLEDKDVEGNVVN